ncbi:MAG: hypothetical protein A2086_02495 [Spirochaetes bacterium GWD1_27_9]|nr:MAG: hypothetical protein A2Y34_16085 [Spirochaetes bacterium GWC1_27_15]OHD30447.1 MAG: hypothetical protein A2086_02495 [Spirochaetes bacterium GWD1_27_9]
MDINPNDFSSLNLKQGYVDQFKTKTEVESLNKAIKKEGKEPVKNLGKDEFLKLLITELQHQDPTNPMQDKEFIAQMAQFSSLEQMVNLNAGMSKLLNNSSFQSSFDLLGKNVEVQAPGQVDENGEQKIIKGFVDSIKKVENDTLVTIDGESYSTSLITKVEK